MPETTESTPGIWITDPAAYRTKLFALTGERDPLQVMAETPGALARIVERNSAGVMRTRPFEGKWTPNEVIGHLLDAEWAYGYRMRQILCEDNPAILGMDQDLWVAGQKHNEREPAELVEMFSAMRRFNLWLWKQMTPADLKRTGQHSERGPESLGEMRRMLAGHDLWHIDQITRYLAAVDGGT